jgi:hypothetical protein
MKTGSVEEEAAGRIDTSTEDMSSRTNRRETSHGLVAGLHQDLVDGDVLRLSQRVNDRRRDVFGIEDSHPAGLTIAFQRLLVATQREKVRRNVARLDGCHPDPRPGRLET